MKVAIVYNRPSLYRYWAMGEMRAVFDILNGVKAVHQALVGLGYSVIKVPLSPPLERAKNKLKSLEVDLVFNLFEGFVGRPDTEAAVADILSELGLVYTGSPGAVLSLALDKVKAKSLMEAAGINTPRCQLLNPETLSSFHLDYPCIVKPCGEDGSHGISEESVVNDTASLARQVERISKLFGGEALVEEFVNGREFNVTVMGVNELTILPVSEIVYSLPDGMPQILTYAAKWRPRSIYFHGTSVICPAEVGVDVWKQIEEIAVAVYRLFGCLDYARVDMRQDNKGQLQVIEINPNPDISLSSGAARQARTAGMTYAQFIEKIVLSSLVNKGQQRCLKSVL